MKNYIYWNDHSYSFFTAKDKEAARDKVINNFDLSFNPNFSEIVTTTENSFSVRGELRNLAIKMFFRLIGSGNNVFVFSKQN